VPKMTRDEYLRFMVERPRTAKLATVRADGRPHVAPVWFALDGETVIFMTGVDTVKGRNLRREPRVTLCVDDDQPPFSYAVVEGEAVPARNDPDLLYWSTVIGGRYMGEYRAEEFGRRNAVDTELLVRVTPTRVVAERDVAD
jgi:PPOX class probable F420-dependent enzyme